MNKMEWAVYGEKTGKHFEEAYETQTYRIFSLWQDKLNENNKKKILITARKS